MLLCFQSIVYLWFPVSCKLTPITELRIGSYLQYFFITIIIPSLHHLKWTFNAGKMGPFWGERHGLSAKAGLVLIDSFDGGVLPLDRIKSVT